MYYYKPKYFQLWELVPKEHYEFEKHHKLWMCWDDRILWTADSLRELYGPAVVNNWHNGGPLQYCGWRPQVPPPGQKWAKWSQHCWWNALDLHFKEVTAEEVRRDIKANQFPSAFRHIRCIEDAVSWLHVDCRNYDGLLVVKP